MAGLLGLGNALSTASTKRSGLGKDSSQHQPVELASRLLPKLLDDEFLEKFNTLNVLDFGSAYGPSLELFNQFSCRLCILDVAESLLDWSRDLAQREEMPSSKQMELELGAILAELRGVQFDLLFFWDTLNYLHPQSLGAFANVLKRGVSADFRGHGYLLHKRGVEQKLRSLGLNDRTAIALRGETDVPLFAHNRK
ncbi:MAG: class I SAM-dependent methyltransferase, partial [Pseudomonadota bacterium]